MKQLTCKTADFWHSCPVNYKAAANRWNSFPEAADLWNSLLRYSWPWKALTWDQLSLEAAGQAVLTAANLWMCTWSERSWPENLWNSCPAECFASCLPSYCSCSHSQTSVNQVESTVITCSVWSLPVLCDHYLFCVVITCFVWSLPVLCGHYLFCVHGLGSSSIYQGHNVFLRVITVPVL